MGKARVVNDWDDNLQIESSSSFEALMEGKMLSCAKLIGYVQIKKQCNGVDPLCGES